MCRYQKVWLYGMYFVSLSKFCLQIEWDKLVVALIIPEYCISFLWAWFPATRCHRACTWDLCDTDRAAWSRMTRESVPRPTNVHWSTWMRPALLMKFPLLEFLPREPLVRSCDPAVSSVEMWGTKVPTSMQIGAKQMNKGHYECAACWELQRCVC